MKISKEKRLEVVALARYSAITYKEIAAEYGVSEHYVSTLALRNGVNRNKHMLVPVKEVLNQNVDEQIEEARRKLDALLDKKASLEIRFEWVDPTTVTVFGVTDKFIILEGVAKFREFVTKRMK